MKADTRRSRSRHRPNKALQRTRIRRELLSLAIRPRRWAWSLAGREEWTARFTKHC